MFNLFKKDNLQKGMTFLEVIVTIFILTVGIAGSFSLIERVVSSASLTSSNFKASYLAQEGIELVRNVRDTNWISGDNWLEGIGTTCSCCEVVYNSISIESCNGEPRNLKYDTGSGFYNYTVGEDTRFKRKISYDIQNPGTENEYLKLKAEVMWEERGEEHSVTIAERLYNWR